MRISDWSSDVCSSDLLDDLIGVANVDDHLLQVERNRFMIDDQQRRIADIDQRPQIGQFTAQAGLRIGTLATAPQAFLQPAARPFARTRRRQHGRSEEHTSELQSLMRITYAVFGLKKK